MMGLWIPACDSPHRRPPVDADAEADADADAPDADVPENGDDQALQGVTASTAMSRQVPSTKPK